MKYVIASVLILVAALFAVAVETHAATILYPGGGGTGWGYPGGLSSGSVVFGNGLNPVGTSTSLFWDNTNKRLGIGTTSPFGQLSVNPNALGSGVPEFVIGSSSATHFVVDGHGNVGIGTAAPNAALHILGDTSNDITLNLQQANTVNVGVEFSATGSNGVWNLGVDRRNINAATANNFYISNGATLSTNPRLTISTAGNVGIGTTSPYGKLSVSGFNTNTPGLVVDALSGFTGNLADFKLASSTLFSFRQDGVFSATGEVRAGSSAFTTTGVRIGSLSGTLQLGGVQGSGSTGNSATAEIDLNGISQASTPGVIQFRTGTASVNNQSEVARIAANGNFGIGTTSPNWLLQVAGIKPSFALTDTSAGTNLQHWLFSSMGGNLYIGTSTDGLATSTIPALTISNAGFVGHGTTTPFGFLSVNPNNIGNAPEFVVGSSSATHFTVNGSGAVGVGTTTPGGGSTLAVAGSIYSGTGGFRFPDGTTQTTAAAGGSGTVVTSYFASSSSAFSMVAIPVVANDVIMWWGDAGAPSGCNGANVVEINLDYKQSTYTSTTTPHAIGNGGQSVTNNECAASQSYRFVATTTETVNIAARAAGGIANYTSVLAQKLH